MSNHSSSTSPHYSSAGARNRRQHTSETSQQSYPPQRRATAPAVSFSSGAPSFQQDTVHREQSSPHSASYPAQAADGQGQAVHVHPPPSEPQSPPSGHPSPSSGPQPSPFGASSPDASSTQATQLSNFPGPAPVDVLTVAGVPDFASSWVCDNAAAAPYSDFVDVLRRVLYDNASKLVGDNYNVSSNLITSINEFASLAQAYKPNEENVVVERFNDWMRWFSLLEKSDKYAQAVLSGFQNLASREVSSQTYSLGQAPATPPETDVQQDALSRSSLARAAFISGVRRDGGHAPFVIALVLMLLILHIALQIRDEERRAPQRDHGLSDELDLMEGIISNRGVTLEDVRRGEENLAHVCSEMQSQDFYASTTTRDKLFAALYQSTRSLYMGVALGSSAAAAHTQNLPALATGTAAAATLVTLNSGLSVLKEQMAAKMQGPMYTPTVVASAMGISAQIREQSYYLLMAYMEVHAHVNDILMVRHRNMPAMASAEKRFARFLEGFHRYVRT
ncbi:hypothetical protein HDZ31DRAFT_75651 [Schizophyllum fasciatum]